MSKDWKALLARRSKETAHGKINFIYRRSKEAMKRRYVIALTLMACLLLGAGLAAAQDISCPEQSFNLTAGFGKKGPGTIIGNVTVSNDATNLYVEYMVLQGYTLTETHVSICTSAFQHRPTPGQAPYSTPDPSTKTSTYAKYIIPLDSVLLDPSCGGGTIGLIPCDWIYIAAHAAVTGPSGSDTAYGGTCTGSTAAPNPGNQSWFCQILYQICCPVGPPPPPLGACEETAWARYAEKNKCFNAMTDLTSSKWGWTNGSLGAGNYTFQLYAAAGQCDISKGTLVGTVTVVYTGSLATVTYNMDLGYTLTETHVWVGPTELPLVKHGKKQVPSAAPGLFPYFAAITDGGAKATVEVTVSGPIYVAAHAKVKGFDCPPPPVTAP
jgi:hypothetical protein